MITAIDIHAKLNVARTAALWTSMRVRGAAGPGGNESALALRYAR
jgi:hypothetical protein